MSSDARAVSTGTAQLASSAEGLRSPIPGGAPIRAVLFDVDGTLYVQSPVRLLMAIELLTMPLRQPTQAPARWKALAAYRRAQEQLREATRSESISRRQTAAAAAASGLSLDEVTQLVDEWMIERPLKYLKRFRAAGLDAFLGALERRSIPIGVFSDYPAQSKLDALGMKGRCSVVTCSTDPGINALKPHPVGFLDACRRLGFPPPHVLMVGDRLDADAAGAAAAGMPCVIIGRLRRDAVVPPNCVVLPSFDRLREVLDDAR